MTSAAHLISMLDEYKNASGVHDERVLHATIEAFDASFYLAENPDVAEAQMDPFLHYLLHGWTEGRDPCSNFSTVAYLEGRPWMVDKKSNPFIHFIAVQLTASHEASAKASPELRAIRAELDEVFYREQLLDAEDVLDPVAHYLAVGAASGLDPSPGFSTRIYLKEHPDVRNAGINPFVHYCTTGRAEGRSVSPSRWRPPGTSPLPDVPSLLDQAAVILGSPLNTAEYMAWNLKSARPSQKDLLTHYFALPDSRRVPLTPFFSPDYYLRSYAAEIPDGMDPYYHFLMHGFDDDFDPHPLVSVAFSKRQIALKNSNESPVSVGAFALALEGDDIDPHPLFMVDYYSTMNGDVRRSGMPLFRHYVQSGVAEGRAPNEYFDPAYYIEQHPDLQRDCRAAAFHFFRIGDREAWRPGPMFDARAYRQNYPECELSDLGVLGHFIRVGKRLGRRAIELPTVTAGAVLEPQSITYEAHASEIAVARMLHSEPRRRRIQGFEERDSLIVDDQLIREVRARLSGEAMPQPEPLNTCNDERDHPPGGLSPISDAIRRPEQPLISLVVPVYGCLDLAERCLISLYADPWVTEHCEFVLADDHPLESAEMLARQFPGLVYLRCSENIGFLRNCKRAVSACRGDAYLFVNSDLEVTVGAVRALWDTLNSDEQVAIAGPKIVYPNGRLQEAGCHSRLDGSGQLIGVGDDPDAPEFSWSRNVDYVSGAFMLVRGRFWNDVGGFDEALAPSYCEDLDLCISARSRGYKVRYVSESVVVHHLSASHNELSSSSKLLRVARNQQKIAEKWKTELENDNRVAVIAFYLPQFHTIAENDLWWGSGFTEWSNCAKARPNFTGHYQPHLPADMGFYDLTAPGVIEKQAKLAQRYGVDGFCIHYYNFGGRRILHAPTELILANPSMDVRFCLCWANENWTKNWDGGEREILLEQLDTEAGQDAVIADVIRHMKDPRYIRINGRPLFVLYRPRIVSNLRGFAERFRAAASASGLPRPLLTATEGVDGTFTEEDFSSMGLDAGVEFSPHGCPTRIALPGQPLNENFRGNVFSYPDASRWLVSKPRHAFPYYRCAFPSWDNTARRSNDGTVFYDATPEMFQAQMEVLMRQSFESHPSGERVVFVNAWNEWAEGAHLEPDRFFGHRWLEAVRNARLVSGIF